jgi:fermentation-respiration switch protein FrsA (DUF1100 family)
MIFKIIENKFTFHPERAILEDLSYLNQEASIIESKKYKISIRYKIKDSPHFILFSHGNSSSVDSIGFIYDFFEKLGVSYLAYDYPGYGKSSGKPSEKGCYHSFEIAYDFVVNNLKIPENQIVLHGASLGGAITIDGAIGKPIQKSVLLATFTSPADLAKKIAPYLPGARYISKQFKSYRKISQLSGEVLYIHGENDETVPASHSKKLFDLTKTKSCLYYIPNCGHKDQIQRGGQKFFQVWKTFLEQGIDGLDRTDSNFIFNN